MQRQLSMPGVGSAVGLTEPDAPEHDLIERLAQEFYVQRGRAPGHALDDWVTAEHLVEDLERRLVALAVVLAGVGRAGLGESSCQAVEAGTAVDG